MRRDLLPPEPEPDPRTLPWPKPPKPLGYGPTRSLYEPGNTPMTSPSSPTYTLTPEDRRQHAIGTYLRSVGDRTDPARAERAKCVVDYLTWERDRAAAAAARRRAGP